MKKIVFTCLVACFALFAQAMEFAVDGFYYRTMEEDDSCVEIVWPSYEENPYREMTSVRIPARVNHDGKTYKVCAISPYAFAYCDQMEELELPHCLQRIGHHAFDGCSRLTEVSIPESVTFVGLNAFQNCPALQSVQWNAIQCATPTEDGIFPIFYNDTNVVSFTFGPKVQNIPAGLCFGLFKMESVVLPNSVTEIGAYAFSQCAKLRSIKLSEQLTRIGDCAFDDCFELAQVTFPNTLQHIGDRAFDRCAFTEVTIPESVTYVDMNAFQKCTALKTVRWNAIQCATNTKEGVYPIFYGDSNIVSFSFGPNVQNIPAGLCHGLHMSSVVLPDSVVNIEQYAFDGCKKLSHITIPEKVRTIGNYSFRDCIGLQSVEWKAIDCTIPDCGGYKTCSLFENDSNIVSFIFGKDIQIIPNGICYKMNKIQEIAIPATVKTIGSKAFYGTNLQSLTLPEGLISIQEEAFEHNDELATVLLPESLDSIGGSAFSGCTNLQAVTIPSNVTYIGSFAFSSCKNLREITIPSKVQYIGAYAFDYCDSLRKVTWNTDKVELQYEKSQSENALFGRKSKIESFVFGPKVTTIPIRICANLQNLTSVLLTGDVTRIGKEAFERCKSLPHITFPQSLEVIEKSAFWGSGLKSVSVPENVKEVGECAFAATFIDSINWNARSCIIPLSDSIWTEPFIFGGYDDEYYYWEETESFRPKVTCIIGNHVKDLPDYMFYDMSFSKIVIPDTLQSIGYNTFTECKFEEPVYNTNVFINLPRDYQGAFDIPDGIQIILPLAFEGCERLTDLRIPETVTTIGAYAFAQTGLRSIYIPKSVEEIGYRILAACPDLSSITVDKDNPVFDSRDNCNAIIFTSTNELIKACHNSTIPSSVQTIGAMAFSGCSTLKELHIPQSVTQIDEFAFANSSVKSVFIGENVSNIGDGVFAGCRNLSRIEVAKNNRMYSSGKNNKALVSTLDGLLIAMCSNGAIPADVRTIGAYAAAEMGITSLVIPDNIVEIQEYAFTGCEKMNKLRIGKNVETIGRGAFSDCIALKKVTIPASVTELGKYVFSGCKKLKLCFFEGKDAITLEGTWFSGCHNLLLKSRTSSITVE